CTTRPGRPVLPQLSRLCVLATACLLGPSHFLVFFFFNDPATTEIYTLSLHDALPIYGRFNTSITHAYSIVIGSKHITLNATGGGFLTASKQFRHGATSKSRSNTASNSTKHKSPHLSGWRQIISLIT